jgi:DNA repair photolyase
MVAPVIPGITDEEVPAILEAVASAGATFVGSVTLRLPFAVAPLFEDWLERHFPDRKEKVLNRIRGMRGGKLNDGNFGTRFHPTGVFADQMRKMFDLAARRAGITGAFPKMNLDAFRKPAGPQLSLFE